MSTSHSAGSGSSGTTDVAREQVGQVGHQAAQAGGEVAGTAKEQAQQVVGEARAQARDLLGEARTQAREQAGGQRDRLVGGLRSLGDELGQMADKGEQSGIGTEVARQLSGRSHDLAGYLDGKEPGDLLDEVRRYARTHPGTFLVGAAVAGVLVGRLTRGTIAQARSENDGSGSAPTQYATATRTSYETPGYPVTSAAPVAGGYGEPAYPPAGYEPGVAAPRYAEPGYGEPGYVEPGYAQQPGYVQPGYGEPGYVEPAAPPYTGSDVPPGTRP